MNNFSPSEMRIPILPKSPALAPAVNDLTPRSCVITWPSSPDKDVRIGHLVLVVF